MPFHSIKSRSPYFYATNDRVVPMWQSWHAPYPDLLKKGKENSFTHHTDNKGRGYGCTTTTIINSYLIILRYQFAMCTSTFDCSENPPAQNPSPLCHSKCFIVVLMRKGLNLFGLGTSKCTFVSSVRPHMDHFESQWSRSPFCVSVLYSCPSPLLSSVPLWLPRPCTSLRTLPCRPAVYGPAVGGRQGRSHAMSRQKRWAFKRGGRSLSEDPKPGVEFLACFQRWDQ